jgi:hypothetical protein
MFNLKILVFLLLGGISVGNLSFGSRVFAQAKHDLKPQSEEFEENKIELRQAWFDQLLRGGNDKNIDVAHSRAVAEFQKMDRSSAFKETSSPAWQTVGGAQDSRVSGRATGIAFDPLNPNNIYLAEPEGGLWKTTNHGASWSSLSDNWATSAMGAVAVDPLNPNVIYAATGDVDAPDGLGGIGMYKSVDGGLNWQLIANTNDIGSKSLNILIDSKSPDSQGKNSLVIYHSGSSGVTKSIDAGATWKRVLNHGGTTSLVMNALNTKILVAGFNGGLKRTVDGGATWTTVGTNLPGFGRATVAIGTDDPTHVYASLNISGGIGCALAASIDGGATWSVTNQSVNWLGQQGWYANAIAVSPINANIVIVGGLDIYRSDDGGHSFFQRSFWTAPSGSTGFTHADVHILAYGKDAVYTLTDGGVYHSSSNGDTWLQDMNRGLATLQFVGVDASSTLSYYAGGAQDNGVNRTNKAQTGFNQVLGGDGGSTIISQNDDGQTVYSTYVQAVMEKSNDGGSSWMVGVNGDHNIISNDTLLLENTPFYMNYSVCESNPDFVAIAGNSRVWYSSNGGGDFNSMSHTGQIGGGVQCVHIPSADPQVVYAAGHNGFVYCSYDGGNWKRGQKALTGGVSALIADPNNAALVYAAVGGYGNAHFYVSKDTGYTWFATASNLPDLPALSIAISPDGSMIYLGTVSGVLASKDGGYHWLPLANGMPLVKIMSLQVRGPGKYLIAGTYGRGAYKLDISHLDFSNVGVAQKAPQPTGDVTLSNLYPNPINQSGTAHVSFTIAKEGPVRLAVYDELGREQRVLVNDYMQKGTYDRTLNITGLATGKYFYALTALGHTVSGSMVITR